MAANDEAHQSLDAELFASGVPHSIGRSYEKSGADGFVNALEIFARQRSSQRNEHVRSPGAVALAAHASRIRRTRFYKNRSALVAADFVVLLALLSLPVAGAVADPAVLADQPLGRVATPEEVAQVVSYCALDAPASITGAIVDVNDASYLR